MAPLSYRWLALLVAAFLGSAAFAQTDTSTDATEQRLLHLLDYVSVEYPAFVQNGRVVNAEEYAEQVEFAGQVEQMVRTLPAHPQRDAFAKKAQALLALIQNKQDGRKVVATARELQHDLIGAYSIAVAPKRAPDVSAGANLFATHCAACHGVNGDGAGPQAANLEPAPTNFREPERQSQRSVYGLFSTISLGVEGTSMVAFSSLSAQDRWALAFYVSQFSATDEQRAQGQKAWEQPSTRALFPSLESVVTTTPADAAKKSADGEALLAFLRANPARFESGSQSPIDFSIATMASSISAYRAGNADQAYQLAVTAYLEGFELVEASLNNRDAALRGQGEAAMMAYRNALKLGEPAAQVEASYKTAVQRLEQAREQLSASTVSPTADFVSSLVIILREGLEAILVLAAMAAFLTRTGRRDALPWLHGGWIVAVLLGLLTWVVSSKLIAISGAQREVTEGITALIAATMLLYVGFWLHSKVSAARWSQFIRSQMTTAVTGKALFGIAVVAFIAVYREMFETVLFYQALWLQAEGSGRTAIVAGAVLGTLGLVAVAWLIIRYSVRLPLGLFFGISSVLLAVMAVVFAGQGIAALQEAGKLDTDPLNFPSIPLLGIYPNMQGIALQLALVALIAAGYFILGRRRET